MLTANIIVVKTHSTANILNMDKGDHDWRLNKFSLRGDGCMEC